jgi:glutathione-regulated potassium-efflux system ancillary protein KefC
VNAIDDVDDSIALVDLLRANFPRLPIVARARNIRHYVELRARQVEVIERETFEAALNTGRHVLEALGVDPYRAREMADAFRQHNVATLESLIPLFHDENQMLSVAKAGRKELEELFSRDRKKFEDKGKGGWN